MKYLRKFNENINDEKTFYHFSDAIFDTFKGQNEEGYERKHSLTNKGIYFHTSPVIARYGKNRYECHLKIKNSFIIDNGTYVSDIVNPYTNKKIAVEHISDNDIKYLTENGYDSVFCKYPAFQVVVFKPEQIQIIKRNDQLINETNINKLEKNTYIDFTKYERRFHQTNIDPKIIKNSGFNTTEVWTSPDDEGNYGKYTISLLAPKLKNPLFLDVDSLINYNEERGIDIKYELAQNIISKNRHLYSDLGGERGGKKVYDQLRKIGYDGLIDGGDTAYFYPKTLNISDDEIKESLNKKILKNLYTEKLITNINKKNWWRTELDTDAIKDRGIFLSSSYKEATFYGKPLNKPFKVNIKNPLAGDEYYIMRKLKLPIPDNNITIQDRFLLDKKMKQLAENMGYDSIALVSEYGYIVYKKYNIVPKNIELNVFNISDVVSDNIKFNESNITDEKKEMVNAVNAKGKRNFLPDADDLRITVSMKKDIPYVYEFAAKPNHCETNVFEFIKHNDKKRFFPVGGYFITQNNFPVEHWWIYDAKNNKQFDITPDESPAVPKDYIKGYVGVIEKNINDDIEKATKFYDVEFFKGGTVEHKYFSVIRESTEDNGYFKWKKQNVTYRGAQEAGKSNASRSGVLGRGLYTAPRSNIGMTKNYGERFFVVNGKPKNPKIFQDLNSWEIWFYNNLVFPYSKAKGEEFPDIRDFNKETTIENEMQKLGYDGIEIKGREFVNYKPTEDVKYFKTEDELRNYYYNKNINEALNKDIYFTDYVKDLTEVGKSKLVGYLPLSTIEEYAGKTEIENLEKWALLNKLKSEIFKSGKTGSGALYIWEESGLQKFLQKNKHYLLLAGVPLIPSEYIHYIEHNIVYQTEFPEAYEIIGKSFNDHRWR